MPNVVSFFFSQKKMVITNRAKHASVSIHNFANIIGLKLWDGRELNIISGEEDIKKKKTGNRN